MSYAGFYINLDRSAARRAAVEAQLAKFGLSDRYHRFAAVEGNPAGIINPGIAPGEVGCLLSHLTLLKQNVGAGLHVHVMEDDVLLSRHTRPAIETVIASGLIDDYDLLFTETFIPPLARELGRLKALYDRQVASAPGPGERRLNLAVVEYFHATSSYIANKNAIGRVVAVLDRDIGRHLAVQPARHDHRNLALELHVGLEDALRRRGHGSAQCVPCGLQIALRPDRHLALAVIAQPHGLEIGRAHV